MKECFYRLMLKENEEVVVSANQHFVSRLKIHVFFVVFLVSIMAFVSYLLGKMEIASAISAISKIVVMIVIVVPYFVLWKTLLVRRGLILTTHGIYVFKNSLFFRSVTRVAYNSIDEFDVSETFVGRIFGYGSITLNIADQDEAIKLEYYNKINEVQKAISNQI